MTGARRGAAVLPSSGRGRTALLGAVAVAGVLLVALLLPSLLPGPSGPATRADASEVLRPADEEVVLPPREPPSPAPEPPSSLLEGAVDVPMTWGGLEREYVLLPALDLPEDEPAALLVVLHQDVSSGAEVARDLGLDPLRRHGVTLAYPNGLGGSWNAGACCGAASEQRVDDVGFVNAVLEDVGRRTAVDPDRRAVLGYSGGAMLAYHLLCRPHPELLAVVEVNGSLETHCPPGTELPDLLSVHGADDGSIGLDRSRFVNHLGMAPRSVSGTLGLVTATAGCGPRRATVVNGVGVWKYDGCRGGGRVDVHVVPDAGHGWADVGGADRAVAWLLPRLTGEPAAG